MGQAAIKLNFHRETSDDPSSKANASELYKNYCKPKLADLLSSLGLDIAYTRASGNYLYYENRTPDGMKEIPVLDLVGGFGACLFGHNHPEIKNHLMKCLMKNTPAFAQCGIRPETAKLAETLNRLIPTKGKYYCNFTNSGAEAVEATLKHAYKVRLDAVRREYETVARQLNDQYNQMDSGEIEAELPEEFKDLTDFRDTIDEHNLAQVESFQNNPVVCAFKGSFHGKTTTALKLTFNKTYREGFEGMSSIRTVFFETGRPDRLKEIVEENLIEFLVPILENGRIRIRQKKMTKVVGFIMEVILGEGGVHAVPDESLAALANLHGRLGIPYIIDEIQTGCGRTGSVAAYAQTPLAAIEPEYLVFGKVLGGGIVKIAASLVHESVYDPDFGLLHTSTYAEDDLSSSVAIKVLEMLTRENGKALGEVAAKGDYFMHRLRELKEKYPAIVKDVRGRGLMLGLEFTQLKHLGPFFRYAGGKGFISLLVASYLLHRHNLRVIAPLSTLFKGNPGKTRPAILRIQPPLTITKEEIDLAVAALDDVLDIIRRNNEYFLVAHLIGESPSRDELKTVPVPVPSTDPRTDFDARVGFVVHITKLEYLVEYFFPSFRFYPWKRENLIRWWNLLSRFLEPELVHRAYVQSGGFTVEANILFVPYLAEHMVKTHLRARGPDCPRDAKLFLREMQDKIQDAAIMARDLGDERILTSIVGLGAYTSILTDNGKTMNDYEIPVTTGNAYTTALMVQGILKAAELKNVPTENASAAVVGVGNIGSTLAEMLCFHVGKVVLVGREGRDGALRAEKVREACLEKIIREIADRWNAGTGGAPMELKGLAKTLYKDFFLPALDGAGEGMPEMQSIVDRLRSGGEIPEGSGAVLDGAIRKAYGTEENPFIRVSKIDGIRECDVVTVATNSTDAKLVNPDNVKKGAIVSCASIPSNLSRSFEDRLDEYFVFDGGYARLPENGAVDFAGMPSDGLALGCFSETLILGFEGRNRSFCKGDLSSSSVDEISQLAGTYGFELGEFRLNDRVLPAAVKMNNSSASGGVSQRTEIMGVAGSGESNPSRRRWD